MAGTLNFLSGQWPWGKYESTDISSDFVIYHVVISSNGTVLSDAHSISYTKSTKTWADYGGSEPHKFNSVDDGDTASLTLYNPEKVFGFYYDSNGVVVGKLFEFVNPWYEAPPEEPPTGTEGDVDCSLTYNAAENHMQAFIHKDLPSTDMLSTRNLYYRVRNTTNVSTDYIVNHTTGINTYLNFDPTVYGVYHLEKVLTNPLEVFSCDSASVTQSNLSGNNTPPNTPRGRRGNLNFW